MHENSLANLNKNRQPRYTGEHEKKKITVNLAQSSRDFLSRGGYKRSQMIEFLVYLFSSGTAGLIPKGETWNYLHEQWQDKLNPPTYEKELASAKNELTNKDIRITQLEQELAAAEKEISTLKEAQMMAKGNEVSEAIQKPEPQTHAQWLEQELEKDCYNPVIAYASPNAGRIITRTEMLNQIAVGKIKSIKHGEKIRDDKGLWWQALRKEKLRDFDTLFQYHGVKILFVGLESEEDSWRRYV